MEKQRAKVGLDGKPFVWSLTVEGGSYPAQLRGEALHVLPTPNMLLLITELEKATSNDLSGKLEVASVSDQTPIVSRL